jgi:solute:Na+ symporter, SSS family
VMIIGVLMFTFYLFTPPPMLFNPAHDQRVRESARAGDYAALEQSFGEAVAARRSAAEQLADAHRSGDRAAAAARAAAFHAEEQRVAGVRAEAIALVKEVSGDATYNDINYVFPTFVMTHLPVGLIGLLMAAIFAAAMSTIAGELSALSTATVIDFYRRWIRDDGDEAHLMRVSRAATLFWAFFAAVTAIWAVELGSLIEVVNRFGSFFYGSILGVFLLAIGWKRATGTGAFVALFAGMGAVSWVALNTTIAFLWHNLIGAVVVFGVGMIVSEFGRRGARLPAPGSES